MNDPLQFTYESTPACWVCYFDPEGSTGRGPTKQAALADLLFQYDDADGTLLLAGSIMASIDVEPRVVAHPTREPDNYVAWCHYRGGGIYLCDSDAPGAFKVYRHPAQQQDAVSLLREVAALWPEIRQLQDGFLNSDPNFTEWDHSVRDRCTALSFRLDPYTARPLGRGEPPGVARPTWADGMERAAELLDEEAASADHFLKTPGGATTAAEIERLEAIKENMVLMARTVRGFRGAGPECLDLSVRVVPEGEPSEVAIPNPSRAAAFVAEYRKAQQNYTHFDGTVAELCGLGYTPPKLRIEDIEDVLRERDTWKRLAENAEAKLRADVKPGARVGS